VGDWKTTGDLQPEDGSVPVPFKQCRITVLETRNQLFSNRHVIEAVTKRQVSYEINTLHTRAVEALR
jgi:hypothetical protein